MSAIELIAGHFNDAARAFTVTVTSAEDVKLYVYEGPPGDGRCVCTIAHAATDDPTITWSAVYIGHSQPWKENVLVEAIRVWHDSLHGCDG